MLIFPKQRIILCAILTILVGCQKFPLEPQSYPILFKPYYVAAPGKIYIQILPPDSLQQGVEFLVNESEPVFRFNIFDQLNQAHKEYQLLGIRKVNCPDDTIRYEFNDAPIYVSDSAGVQIFVQKNTLTSAQLFQEYLNYKDTLPVSDDDTLTMSEDTLNFGREYLFTLIKPDTISRKDWIPNIYGPLLLEDNQKSSRALLLVAYGFLDVPDQVIILESILPWKVAATINLGNAPNKFELLDLNHDGVEELILASGGCGTGREYGGQNSSVGYCYATDLSGNLLWTFAADTVGGPISLFVIKKPEPRLFFIQHGRNFCDCPMYTNLYELEPATGRMLRHKRFTGLGEFAHSDLLDSSHFVLVADNTSKQAYWLNFNFCPQGSPQSIPLLEYIKQNRDIDVGSDFPPLYALLIQGGEEMLVDDNLKPQAYSEFILDPELANQSFFKSLRQRCTVEHNGQKITLIRARTKDYTPCLIYATKNPFWWFYRWRWELTIIIGFITIIGGGFLGYKYWQRRRQHQRDVGIWQQFMSPRLIQLFKANDPRRKSINYHLDVTILNADLRNFTEYSESVRSSQIVLDTLAPYYEYTSEEVSKQGGVMDKFMGDGGMALFGIPPWHSAERRNQPLRAFNVCENLLSNFNSMKNAWIEKGYPVDRVGIGFGIATGKVSFGTIGKGKRIDLTVIGSAANLSARLCAMAKHGEIKMDLVTYTAVKECLGPCERTVHTNIKGFESVPVEVFTWSKPQ